MSEIRRKLVIVGDGACGKVIYNRCHSAVYDFWINTPLSLDLSVDRLLQRNISRGLYATAFFGCDLQVMPCAQKILQLSAYFGVVISRCSYF